MRFDEQQQQAIRSLNNTVITAGAGAGKTSVLAERYLWLLQSKKARVDEVLTLTFTKKAAAEMYEKIYRRLKGEQDPAVREQLRDFSQAQISTLDSFCAQIVRNSSELFGLPEDFTYDTGMLSELLARTSLDFLLSHWQDKGAAVLLELYGFQRVLHEILRPLAASFFNLAGDYDFTRMLADQCAELEQRCTNERRTFSDRLARLAGMDAGGKKSILQAQELAAGLVDLDGFCAAGEYKQALALLRDFSLRKPGGKASEEIIRFKQLVDEIKAAQAVLISLLAGLDKKEELKLVFALLAEFQRVVNHAKRSMGL
ncbi:MAG: UvrD-helicase domain-containing protein, partial [Spirochaetia bacterium]